MRLRPALTVVVIATLLLGFLGPAQADDERRRKSHVDAALRDLRHDMNETSRELRAAARMLSRAESRLPAARARVARVHGRLVAAEARDRQLGEQLQVAIAEVQRAKGQIRDTKKDIAAGQVLIGRIARSSYQDGGMGELAVVLQSQSPDDFATRLVLVQNAMRSEGSVLGRLAEARADLAAEKATLVAKRAQVQEMKDAQEALVAQIQGLQAEAIEAKEAVQALIDEREQALAAVEREKAAEEARYAEMQAESQRLGRILAERARQARLAAARARAAGRSAATGSGVRGHHLAVRHARPPGDRRLQAARRHRLRRRLRHRGARGGVRHGDPGRQRPRLRQPAGHRPRHHARRRAGHQLQPPQQLRRRTRSPRVARSGDRLQRWGSRDVRRRLLDGLPPALHGLRQRRHHGPHGLALTG
jgi:peptidoglycan hydrolase CwlO-like protein